MEEEKNLDSPKINWLKLLIKIVVSIGCLWYVFTKIDFNEAFNGLKKANFLWLFTALLIYYFSKYLGAKRLLINFKNIGVYLQEIQNVKLYWLGMFYNLFLPGAITGDAYKVIILSKKFNISYKKATAAVILDRFSGLLALGLLLAIYSYFSIKEEWLIIILVIGSIAAVPILYFIIKKFFKDFISGFWPTFFWGVCVQLSILVCVYIILYSLNITEDVTILIFIFLVAIIISVLPISIGGGLGVREFAILEGAKLAGLGSQGQQNALILSLLFYLITVLCSLTGLVFVFKDPLKNKSIA